MGDVFLNEVYVGTVSDSKKFVLNFKKQRRTGAIEDIYNIKHESEYDFIHIDSTPGRVRRPVIIVENGVSKLTKEIYKKLKTGDYSYADLISEGVIEYLDAMEEDDDVQNVYHNLVSNQ